MANQEELIPHLFRTEYSKIVSVLCRLFGFEHIETAEDIASDTFLTATETWGMKGLPDNPTAWLYNVAKNKAKNQLRRSKVFVEKVSLQINRHEKITQEQEIDLSSKNILDSQLQMMFALCQPSIPPEAQIALSLRVLCGFGIDEIAEAFLTGKEIINKRLSRAKEKLRSAKIKIEFPGYKEIDIRLDSVLTILYLLFNEGYYSSSQNRIMSKDLCLEAVRLTHLLTQNEYTDMPKVNALLALMCFHASRFEARIDTSGQMVLYDDQDTSRWDTELTTRGEYYLNRSANGNKLSKYHLEAAIAYWYTIKNDSAEKWENILQLYNQLLILEYSPMAALNRTYSLSKAKNKETAIAEAEKLGLEDMHLYHSLMGYLYTGVNKETAISHLSQAHDLTKNIHEKKLLSEKLQKLMT